MKKLFIPLILLILFIGCEKEKITSYQVVNNGTREPFVYDTIIDQTLFDVVVFCFNDKDEVVRQDDLLDVPPDGGQSEIIETTPDIVKVKVSFMFIPENSLFYDMEENVRRYTNTIFYLTPNENTQLIIDDNTMLKKSLN